MIKRKSNIELMRIIAMLMIIDVHYFASCNAGTNIISGTNNWIVYQVMESVGICGVNLFVLITGFFSLNENKIKIRKIINLLLDVAFWGGLGFILCVLVGWKALDIKEIIKTMFPILFGGRWFVRAYIVLLCLIPFVNIILRSITKRSYQKLLIIITILFSVWPSFFPNPPLDDYGYGFVHFIYLYIIGGYIKSHLEKYPPRWVCLCGYFLSTFFVVASSISNVGEAWAYNYVCVVAQAVCLLLFFSQIKLQSSIVNQFAACAFGVFLIHTDIFFSTAIYDRLLRCNELANGNTLLFFMSCLASLPIFYILGTFLESIKKKVFDLSINRLMDKVTIFNLTIKI